MFLCLVFFLLPSGSWVYWWADVRAELFRDGVADLSVPQPVYNQSRQPRGELLWPGGKKKRSPAKRQPASCQPRPNTPRTPTGAQRPAHTEQGPPVTHNQVRNTNMGAPAGRWLRGAELLHFTAKILYLWSALAGGHKACLKHLKSQHHSLPPVKVSLYVEHDWWCTNILKQ